MKTALLALLLALGALSTGCAPGVSLSTPPGFAVLDKQQEYAYRATSAEGVVLAVRSEKNEPQGNLDFWADALVRQLLRGGYALDGEPKEVRTRAGLVGREARFTGNHGGRPARFWIAVFVTEGRVWVVEAGGDADRFKGKAEAAVEKAIGTLAVN